MIMRWIFKTLCTSIISFFFLVFRHRFVKKFLWWFTWTLWLFYFTGHLVWDLTPKDWIVCRTNRVEKKSVSTDYVSTCFPQGGSPSPFDRIQGTRQATLAVNWLVEKIEQSRTFEGTFRLNTLSFSSWLSFFLNFRRRNFGDKHWNRRKCAFVRFIFDLLSQVLQTTLLLCYVFDCAFQSLKRAFLQTSSQTSISLPTWSACTL